MRDYLFPEPKYNGKIVYYENLATKEIMPAAIDCFAQFLEWESIVITGLIITISPIIQRFRKVKKKS